jgi:hypothetical protein
MISIKGNKEKTNMQRKRLALTVVMAIVLAVGSTAVAAPEPGWLTTDEGTKVWLTGIEPGDTATWTGGRDAENYADGPGVLQCFKKGKLNSIFEGTLKKGRIQDGFGKYRGANGITYEGNFVNTTYSGKGTMKWADGRIYEGDWANGTFNGKGHMKIPDGRTYEGDYVNGVAQGKGVMKFPNGRIHEGDWVNGVPSGKGIVKEPDGRVYEGDFLEGNRTGKGILRFPDGARYEGEFLIGEFHGNGVLYGPDGKVLMRGKWEKNKLVSGPVTGVE